MNWKKFILDRIHSRGITYKDNGVTGGKSFGYLAYPIFNLNTEKDLNKEKRLAFKWMRNNPKIISINYGEGHLWFATLEKIGNKIKWRQRKDFKL